MLNGRKLGLHLWEDLLLEALYTVRTLLGTATNEVPQERFFPFPRRSMLGTLLPSWLVMPGKVRQTKFVHSKHDPVCEEVEIFDAIPRSSLVRFPDGKETPVYTPDLTPVGDPAPQPESDTVVGTKESSYDTMGDSFNEMGSSKEGTAEVNKRCSDIDSPSKHLDEQPVRRSSRIRCPTSNSFP